MRLLAVSLTLVALSLVFVSAVLVLTAVNPLSHEAKLKTAVAGWATTSLRQ
jgi:hypothetical protein